MPTIFSDIVTTEKIVNPSQGASNHPNLWMQTVLYEPNPSELNRFFRGVEAAVTFARSVNGFRSISLVVGDCSATAALDDADQERRDARLHNFGVDQFDYRFYGANLGHGGGQNRAFEGCDGDLVLVANPDTYLCPDILIELAAPFADASVGAVEARQLPLEHPKAFDLTTYETSWASGACVMVRSDAFRAVAGFDASSFFMYCDDVDLSWRLRLAGYRILHQPSARVFHDKRLTPDAHMQVGPAEFYYSAEAALLMAWKYSRDDVLRDRLEQLRSTGHPEYLRAVETFERRRQSRELPERIDAAGRVATFVGLDYAVHRFAYG